MHLHKTGGSSFEIAAEPTLRWHDLLLGSTKAGEDLNEYYLKRFSLNKHSSVSDIYKNCGRERLEGYRVLTIVRHPIKRVISLFNFIGGIVDKYCRDQSISLSQLSIDYGSHCTTFWPLCWPASEAYIKVHGDFDLFVLDELLKNDTAFDTQYSQLFDGDSLAKDLKIVKLEEIKSSHPILDEFVGQVITMPHENKSASRKVSFTDCSNQVIRHLEDRFHDDLKAFNYQ